MSTLTSIAYASVLAALTLFLTQDTTQESRMELGSFTVCLAVKDLEASMSFYAKLDFEEVSGDKEQHWIVMQNGTTKIALFQGLLEKNMLTFNPGQTPRGETLEDFQDVRELQRILKGRGVELTMEADEASDGPAHFMLADPDGNSILFDQYAPKPTR